MSIIKDYLKIIGELGNEQGISANILIMDLLIVDAVSTHFVQSGIKNIREEYAWREYSDILSQSLQTDLIKTFMECLHNISEKTTNMNVVEECSLLSEHIIDIDIDLSHYSLVTDSELEKLRTIIEKKYPNQFVIMTVNLPLGNTIIEYLNTFKQRTKQKTIMSDLHTLLSLYMEVNSGDRYE